MKTLKHSTKQRVLQIAGTLALLTQTNLAGPLPLPQITSPANGVVITQPQVDVQISVDGYRDVQVVAVYSNGKVIGNAQPTSFFGEWSFPDGTHISILEGTGGEVKIDYTPPGSAPMFLIDGGMSGANTFSGSFIHWPGGGVTNTGTATATFTFSNYGQLTVAFDGQAPLGKRVVTGGLSGNTAYHFVWKNPPAGAQALTTVVTWLNSGTTAVAVSDAVNVTVKVPKLPEIVIQQPKGSGLTDGVGKKSFGTSQVGKAGPPKTFVIKNTGTAKLTGLSITKTGNNAKDFLVVGPAKSSLAAGESTTFKVTFKPTAKGTRNAVIKIKSNDPDENPFDINLTGMGAPR
jgi:hypothetical protein